MKVEQAKGLIVRCADEMSARYKKVVFDEWAMISLADNKGLLLSYTGPRKEGFKENFLVDAGGLRSSLLARAHAAGDFEFTRHGVGTGFEAFMVLGPSLFLICNNTARTMDEIAKATLAWSAGALRRIERAFSRRPGGALNGECRMQNAVGPAGARLYSTFYILHSR